MIKLEVYDPALCCSTGVCGTEVDAGLVQFASDAKWLKEKGGRIERFNLAQQPSAFAGNPLVRNALAAKGNDCLPLVLVDGVIVMQGSYPSRVQLASLAGVAIEKSVCCCGETETTPDENGDCCSREKGKDAGPSSCC